MKMAKSAGMSNERMHVGGTAHGGRIREFGCVLLAGIGEDFESLMIFMNGALLYAGMGQSGIFVFKCFVMMGIMIPPTLPLMGMSTVQFPPQAGQVNLRG